MKKLIGLLAISLLFLFPQVGWTIGGVSGIGAPLSPNRIGGDDFIRYIGDRLILDFHEGAGTTVRDLSGNGNDGTFAAGAAAPTWKHNRLSFDGGDDYVSVSHSLSLDITNVFTLSLSMASLDLDQSSGYLLNLGDIHSVVYEYVDNQIELFSTSYTGDNPRIGSQIEIIDTSEHDIVYIYDGSTWEGYKDHRSQFSLSKSFVLGTNTEDTFLGARKASSKWVNVTFSFIRINATAFSANQVLQEYLWNKWRS